MSTRISRVRIITTCAACLIAWLVLPAAGQSPPGGKSDKPRRARPPAAQKVDEVVIKGGKLKRERKKPDEGPAALRFEATVFQVVVPAERTVGLDSKKLAAEGATPGKLFKMLRELGDAQMLYRVDQAIAADGKRTDMRIGRDTPYVSSTQISGAGQVSTTVARRQVGGEFRIRGTLGGADDPSRLQIELAIEIAVLSNSVVQVGPAGTAPVFWSVEQNYRGGVKLGQPFVLLSVDGASTTGPGQPLAFVSLVRLSRMAN